MRSGDPDVTGIASCEFAQRLWDGDVNDEVLLDFLRDESDTVRAEVAWAVADARRPKAGVEWLVSTGLGDTSPRVRYWATFYMLESNFKFSAAAIEQMRTMANDESPDVRRNIAELIARHETP